jgi:hypothetical protein
MAMDVDIVGSGTGTNVHTQVDPLHRAFRTSTRPPDKGVYGSYSLGLTSGTVAAAMATPLPIWEMRWYPQNVVCLIRRVRFSASAMVEFAIGSFNYSLLRATGFSALDATGGATAPTILGKSQAKSSRFAPTQLQSTTQAFVILNTANTGLTGGTKTLDNNPLVTHSAGVPITAGTGITQIVPPGTLLFDSSSADEPIELAQNEGLVLRSDLVPATGTWTFSVTVEWDEVDPSKYFG